MCAYMPKDITREELWHKLKIARQGYSRLWYVINSESGISDNLKELFNEDLKGYQDAIRTAYSEEDLKELKARADQVDKDFDILMKEKNNGSE
jgi:hypothetical protein